VDPLQHRAKPRNSSRPCDFSGTASSSLGHFELGAARVEEATAPTVERLNDETQRLDLGMTRPQLVAPIPGDDRLKWPANPEAFPSSMHSANGSGAFATTVGLGDRAVGVARALLIEPISYQYRKILRAHVAIRQ
jgi:hypothetical protein